MGLNARLNNRIGDRDPASRRQRSRPPGGSDLLFLSLEELTPNLCLTFLQAQTILGEPQAQSHRQTKQEDEAVLRTEGATLVKRWTRKHVIGWLMKQSTIVSGGPAAALREGRKSQEERRAAS